jgi:hypothetical protein
LRTGQVVGQSNKIAGEPATEPVRIPNVVGTILHSLFDIGKLRITRGVPRELLTMAEYTPIEVLH